MSSHIHYTIGWLYTIVYLYFNFRHKKKPNHPFIAIVLVKHSGFFLVSCWIPMNILFSLSETWWNQIIDPLWRSSPATSGNLFGCHGPTWRSVLEGAWETWGCPFLKFHEVRIFHRTFSKTSVLRSPNFGWLNHNLGFPLGWSGPLFPGHLGGSDSCSPPKRGPGGTGGTSPGCGENRRKIRWEHPLKMEVFPRKSSKSMETSSPEKWWDHNVWYRWFFKIKTGKPMEVEPTTVADQATNTSTKPLEMMGRDLSYSPNRHILGEWL